MLRISFLFLTLFFTFFGALSWPYEEDALGGGPSRFVHLNTWDIENGKTAGYDVEKPSGGKQGLCVTFTPSVSWVLLGVGVTEAWVLDCVRRTLGTSDDDVCALHHPLSLVYSKPPAHVAAQFKTEVFGALKAPGLRYLVADWQALEVCADGSSLPLGDFSGTLESLTSLTLRNMCNVPPTWWGWFATKAPNLKKIVLHSGAAAPTDFQTLAAAFPDLKELSLLDVGVAFKKPEDWNKGSCIPVGLERLDLLQCFEHVYFLDKAAEPQKVVLSKDAYPLFPSKFLGARTQWDSLISVSFSMLRPNFKSFFDQEIVRGEFRDVFSRVPNLSSFKAMIPTFDPNYQPKIKEGLEHFFSECAAAYGLVFPLLGVSEIRWDKGDEGNTLTMDLAEVFPFTDNQKFSIEGKVGSSPYGFKKLLEDGGLRVPVFGKLKPLTLGETKDFYKNFGAFLSVFPSIKTIQLKGEEGNFSIDFLSAYFGKEINFKKVPSVSVSQLPPELLDVVREKLIDVLEDSDLSPLEFHAYAVGFALLDPYLLLTQKELSHFSKQVPNGYTDLCQSPFSNYLWLPLSSKSHRPVLPFQAMPIGADKVRIWFNQGAERLLDKTLQPVLKKIPNGVNTLSLALAYLFPPISNVVPLPFVVERADQVADILWREFSSTKRQRLAINKI